jgi:hypothetical protein
MISPSHLLQRLAKQPIASLRHAALDLMRAIAGQSSGWGLCVLFNCLVPSPSPAVPGRATQEELNNSLLANLNNSLLLQCEFWMYLKDRVTEYEKEGKLYKFALIETIGRNEMGRRWLPSEMLEMLGKIAP